MTVKEIVTVLKTTDSANLGTRCGIVLSAGNGTRLQEFVRRQRGDCLPKQYINFIGARSMLERTCHRAARLIPEHRLFVIVAKEHLTFREVKRQLASIPPEALVIQPANRETAPGVLLPLLRIHKRYPNAIVALFPSDHFVLEEDRFMRHVEHAFRVVEADASRMVLLGLEPHGPDPEYGYIVPGERIDTFPPDSMRQVEMFVEKPCAQAAQRIIASGALWNTMVMVFACKTLLSVIRRAAPKLYHSFDPILDALGTPDEQAALERVYENLPSINFSKGVLEVLPFEHRRGLLVLPVRGVTWSDWGTVDHLTRTLRDLAASEDMQSVGVL
jgi:mannose-1-phosphate guanylyltransferase